MKRSPLRYPSLASVVALLAAVAVLPVFAQQEDFPGFRGRTGAGVVNADIDVADLAPRVAWRTRVGIGYSGVTVADGRAITMFEDGEQFMVAFDAENGRELWRRRVAAAYPGRDGSWNGPIATPVVHGNLVIALEPWGRLFALDTADGEPVWSVDLDEDLGAPRPVYGFGSSPVVAGEVLVVHGGGEAGALLGFDLATGEHRWSVGAEVVEEQSPVVLTLAGREMVVAAGEANLFGIDAASGEVLWEYAHEGSGFRGSGSLVPVGLDEDRLFLAHSDDESQVVGIRAADGGLVAEQVWADRTIRNSYTVAVHHEGYIYAYSARIFVCVDAATGELQWRSRYPGDGFITLVGDNMIVLTKDGSLHVVRATPSGYEELASTTVFDELTWSPPSFAYGAVFARSLDEVVRVDLHGGDAALAAAEVAYNVPRSVDPGDGEFGRFIAQLQSATDPEAAIDEFLQRHPESPIFEGDDLAHLVYRGNDEVMAIAGDFIGARQEAPMVRVGDTSLFYYSVRLAPDSRTSYVFVRESETITDPRNPLAAETLIFDADREFGFGGPPLPVSELRMPGWTMPAHLREAGEGVASGSLETLTLTSEVFGDVEWQVYLPAGYADSDERYPVVYYHGQTPRDLSAVPTSLDNLIADGMRPVIAVFCEAFLPPIPQYNDFWADQLVPAVDSAYRTIAAAEGRVGVGGALGTLQAMFLAFGRPELTSGVGLHTMFFLDSDWDMLVPLLKPANERPLRLYIDWGMYDLNNPQEAWDDREMSRIQWGRLVDLGFEPQGGEAPDGTGWVSWRNRADQMLRALVPQE